MRVAGTEFESLGARVQGASVSPSSEANVPAFSFAELSRTPPEL